LQLFATKFFFWKSFYISWIGLYDVIDQLLTILDIFKCILKSEIDLKVSIFSKYSKITLFEIEIDFGKKFELHKSQF
jgi:hypothetical protein